MRGHDRSNLWNRNLKIGEDFQQEGFEFLIAAINFVNQQHRRTNRVGDGLEQRTFQKEGLAENRSFFFSYAPWSRLLKFYVKELSGVIPFVERGGGIQTLVALKPY